MSKTNRPGAASQCSPAHVEPLEPRQLLSAAYSAVNLSRLVPDYAQRSLQGFQITNSGLVALDNWMIASGNSVQGFIYSLSGHHLYSAPPGYVLLAINDAGDAVRKPHVSPGGPVIDFQGQSHEIPLLDNATDTESFSPSSMNAAGQVAGVRVINHHPQTLGAGVLTSTYVLDANGRLVVAQDAAPVAGGAAPPSIDDAGTLAFNRYTPDGNAAAVYRGATQTVTSIDAAFKPGTVTTANGINASGQVIGTYSRGRRVAGFFLFDSATDALRTFPTAAGESPYFAAISDNGTIVGTVSHAARARNHTVFQSDAVLITQAGEIEDLNTMTAGSKHAIEVLPHFR